MILAIRYMAAVYLVLVVVIAVLVQFAPESTEPQTAIDGAGAVFVALSLMVSIGLAIGVLAL